MKDELKKVSEEKLNYFLTWLNNFGKASEIAPYVRQASEIAQWEYETISDSPASLEPPEELRENYYQNFNHMQYTLPQIPDFSTGNKNSIPLVSTTTGNVTFAFLYNIHEKTDKRDVREWSKTGLLRYEEIQKLIKKCEQIQSALQKFDSELAKEFSEGEKSVEEAVGRWQSFIDATIAMRNVLEHLRGILFVKARKPSEQKFKWEDIIVERLSIYPKGSREYVIFASQENAYKNLHNLLTQILKNLQPCSVEELKIIHAQYLDYIHIVLLSIGVS